MYKYNGFRVAQQAFITGADLRRMRKPKNNGVPSARNIRLIQISKKKIGKARIKAYVGFDTQTIKEYPELILIEFGRPGKSPRHSKTTDKLKRKKGSFPEAATVMPIRAGFNLAKESALAAYAQDMFDRAQQLFNGR